MLATLSLRVKAPGSSDDDAGLPRLATDTRELSEGVKPTKPPGGPGGMLALAAAMSSSSSLPPPSSSLPPPSALLMLLLLLLVLLSCPSADTPLGSLLVPHSSCRGGGVGAGGAVEGAAGAGAGAGAVVVVVLLEACRCTGVVLR